MNRTEFVKQWVQEMLAQHPELVAALPNDSEDVIGNPEMMPRHVILERVMNFEKVS